MKYIRTKDGEIFEVENQKPWATILCKPKYIEMLVAIDNEHYEMRKIIHTREIGKSHWKTDIIKQADTIEELCDEFVVSYENTRIVYGDLEWAKTKAKSSLEYGNKSIIYGAIWTDKGLIYVAKMNSKGELELL